MFTPKPPTVMMGLPLCRCLASGMDIKAAAAKLNIDRWVADARLKYLRRKFACATTYQLMAVLGQKGLLMTDNKDGNGGLNVGG